MKSASKLALLLAALLAPALLTASDRLFTAVPANDPTYVQLKRLEDLGMLPKGASAHRLTRYEVAQLIFKAKGNYARKYRGVRLAQLDLPPDLGADLGPPPDFGSDMMVPPPGMEDLPAPDAPVPAVSAPAPSAPVPTGPAIQAPSPDVSAAPAATGPSVPAGDIPAPPDSAPDATSVSPAQVVAARAIGSLEQAYQEELKALQGDVAKASERVKKLEGEQFKLWKRIRALDNSTAIFLNGIGRAFTYTDAKKGDTPGPQHIHYQSSYLDLNPNGIVSKEIRWFAVFRVQSSLVPQTSGDLFTIRRATIEFNPAWMSSTFGDFEESYTPLTLWNRHYPDYRYYPEIRERLDYYSRYEGFLDREEYLPFRGARFGTAVMWPKSDALEALSVSSFVHMINSGMVTGAYAAHRYTGWIFGGKSSFKARKFFGVEAHGLLFDEPMDTDDPGSAYGQYDPTTWAQRYQVGSVRPNLEFDVTSDVTVGAKYELAYSIYNDDKRDAAKKVEDYARLGGPFVKYQRSTLQFNFVDTGVAYFSPLAQLRTEDVTSFPNTIELTRAGGLFAEYNRYNDNVFPYGLSTPNRKGGGIEVDIKALEKDALGIKASFYQLRENRGNFVMDDFFSDFVPVDGLANSPAAVRSFTYINVGPKLNVAPLLDLPHDVEFGINYRSEKTESWIGQLKSDHIMVGLKVGLKKWWQVSVYGSNYTSKGRESFLNGGTQARYSYIFDNSDLGSYFIVNSETTVNMAQISTRLDVNKNSNFVIDGYTRSEKTVYPDDDVDTKVDNGGGRLIYEIQF